MLKILYLFTLICTSLNLFSQNTFVPNDNFEQALIDLGLDAEPLNDSVPTSAIDTLVYLNISASGVNNMTGIEDFISLTHLECAYNFLGTIDLSANIFLAELNCENNNLTTLDLSSNLNLISLKASRNNLSSLNVLMNVELEYLEYEQNNISSIDLSNNIHLKHYYCSENGMDELDISMNPELLYFACEENNLSELDVSIHPNLEMLACSQNNLSTLDVSHNPLLKYLYCAGNNLPEIDVSNNTLLDWFLCENNALAELNLFDNMGLTHLNCSGNPLINVDFTSNHSIKNLAVTGTNLDTIDVGNLLNLIHFRADSMPTLNSINIANGNNENMITCWVNECPELDCITVDSNYVETASAPENFWKWQKDHSCVYSSRCGLVEDPESKPESKPENKVVLLIYPTVVINSVTIESSELGDYSIFDIAGQQIRKGIIGEGMNFVDLNELSSGTYIFYLNDIRGQYSQKIIKM